ncbi:metabotropic glycine receptor-like [Saccostrea cucullata]|uniref:metabotropic glycine receptor-like n=1 Tax=Saccostrea cuccullata TaxID=36930 RepID=UPI002ECFF49B
MDLCGFAWKNIYYVPLLVELMLLNVLHLAGGETLQRKDSRKYPLHVPITGKSNSTEDGQVPFTPISIQSSLALHYIDSVIRNPSKICLYNRSIVKLDSFKLNIVNSSFCRLYKSHANQVVWIAKSLTGLLTDHNNSKVANLINSHMNFLYEIIKWTLFDNTQISGCGIAFHNDTFLYMAKSNSTGFQDLSTKYNFTDSEFYSIPAKKDYGGVWNRRNETPSRVNVPPLEVQDGYWTGPYYDCKRLQKWIITYSVPFFHRPREKPVFSGVVMIDIDLNQSDVNQCARDQQLFSGSNKCLPETTQCVYIPDGGLIAGSYKCVCRKGFYFPDKNSTKKSFPGSELEEAFINSWYNKTNLSSLEYQCLPCPPGCENCVDDTPCMAEYNVLLRGIPLGIQSFCITVTIVIGIVVLRLRKSKVMVASMWILLEMVLVGAVLLYSTIIIQYFKPTTTVCIMIPWFREMGFAVVYGSLVLKVYRLLSEFQSRKAHRVHVRDKDLLKYLCCVIIVVLGYMSAWTTVTYDHINTGDVILEYGVTKDNLKYIVCKSGWWEYVVEIAELLFLLFGMYLCYRVRSAPSDFAEGTYITAAICYEAVISIVFYVLRHVYWTDLHPDYLFLMSFVRCQLTVTITLLLVFGPKLLYAHRPPDDHHHRNRAYSSSDVQENMSPESMKLNVGISSNGDVDVAEISLADMDPEDIRAELKRLYTQLQVYKTRIMRKDNPHISKRRGGRKQTHRRFSIQPFHLKSRHERNCPVEHEHEISKTPEESTNSAEMSIFEPGIKEETQEKDKENKKEHCTVTFKMR